MEVIRVLLYTKFRVLEVCGRVHEAPCNRLLTIQKEHLSE